MQGRDRMRVASTVPVPANKGTATSSPTGSNSSVVASLGKRSPHPFSAVALSPYRQLAVTACKDSLQIIRVNPSGLSLHRTIPMGHHFQISVNDTRKMGEINEDARGTFVRDTLFGQKTTNPQPNTFTNVVITDVAWSIRQEEETADFVISTRIAAAGSNGVIVIWDADALVDSAPGKPPEAILNQHSRAVNRLAWHPKRPGLLLSGSQDGTVILWERQKAAASVNQSKRRNDKPFNIFWRPSSSTAQERTYTWHSRTSFDPKSEAVRDICWSPFYDDIFALVTTSGSLIVYNMNVKVRALLKMTAHSGDATTLDWHPTKPNIVATGGAGDRCVKVWNLEEHLLMKKAENNATKNSGSWGSRTDSLNTESSSEAERSSQSVSFNQLTNRTWSSQASATLGGSRHKGIPKNMLHILPISASVMRLKWRPPSSNTISWDETNRHETMLAVATAPIKGASAGGSGMLALWSYDRPYMPLSIIEGHEEGAVTDFRWLDTPQPQLQSHQSSAYKQARVSDNTHRPFSKQSQSDLDSDSIFKERDVEGNHFLGIWQHVISVGRDGRCLLQSFARGDRPITRVPPSCFSMANLSPFQRGYGSLQLFSVFQNVPSGNRDESLLSGLRRDKLTSRAPGVFREPDVEETEETHSKNTDRTRSTDGKVPGILFNVLDQGDLDEDFIPVPTSQHSISIAPEVVHLSRFAESYILYPCDEAPTRSAICLHNSLVAEKLSCYSLSNMWRLVASILDRSGLDGLPELSALPSNAMQFIIVPTIKALLEERANAGDVQTCVVLCEVLQVVKVDQTTQINDLDIELVREWYLSYIDLLRDMCLFSHVSFLIRNCRDAYIGAINQQSTTIHESCPQCGKALLQADGLTGRDSTARRVCKSCSQKIARCFLCHEVVQGIYVWCPGCGHGGHLDHALQWFGGMNGKPVREVCPTGCGHKCNMLQPLSAFPRTESLRDLSQEHDLLHGI